MSSWGIAVRRVVVCVLAASGLLGACGRSRKMARDPAGDASASSGRGGAAGDPAADAAPAPIDDGGGQGGEPSGATDGAPSGEADASDGGGAGGASADGGNGGAGGLPPGAVEPSYFHAGTRLKPRVLRGGGLEVLDRTTDKPWYDAQTGVWCNFRKGEDGLERCFPDVEVNENTDYLDSSCKKPVYLGPNPICGGTAIQHLTIGVPAPSGDLGCGGVTYYRLGTPVPAGTPLYSNSADTCQPSGVSTKMAWPLEKVPPETFVAVQRVRRPASPNMDAWVREGADGSSEIVGFFDPVRKAPCAGLGLDVSSNACLPSWLEPAPAFSDSTCTRRVASEPSSLCGPSGATAILELETTDDACSTRTAIKGLWQIASGRGVPLFEQDVVSDLSCKPLGLGDAKTYVQGAPIDVASLPQLDVIPVGTGSLQMPFYGFDNVPFFPAVPNGASFNEAASGDSCSPYLFADGGWRCVPSTFPRVADFDQYYQSSDCTGERVYPRGSACPNARAPVGIVVQLFGCNPPVTETLEFDGTISSTGNLYHPTPSKKCEDAGYGAGATLFRATKAVNPAERFVPFERKLAD